MRYVTRKDVYVDRIATAWAIRRFVDPDAEFLFVDREDDWNGLGAIPFDMRGVELGHHGGRCTFETLLTTYELPDPALRAMGKVIRAIDMPYGEEVPPGTERVRAAFDRLRSDFDNDQQRLLHGAVLCDRVYRQFQSELPG